MRLPALRGAAPAASCPHLRLPVPFTPSCSIPTTHPHPTAHSHTHTHAHSHTYAHPHLDTPARPRADLLLISPGEAVAGPQGAGSRRLMNVADSGFSKIPLLAARRGRGPTAGGVAQDFTVSDSTPVDKIISALVGVATGAGGRALLRIETDGSAAAAGALAAALAAAGDRLRAAHGATRLCMLVDARREVRGGAGAAGLGL